MYKDLRQAKRPSRKKPGMREFFVLILVYSYFNKRSLSNRNEFVLPQSIIAEYFKCSDRTARRWFEKLRSLGFLTFAERENAGRTSYYKKDGVKHSYIIPKQRRIRVGNSGIKFLNVYELNQQGLNDYLVQTVDEDVFAAIENYTSIFDDFVSFLSERNDTETVLKRPQKVSVLKQNQLYLDKKKKLDEWFPEFTCRYLEEGSLRLTHSICSTVNPEHTEKINDNNYWRSSHIRNDMLSQLLQADVSDIFEYDINGSIYRLTYNLHHDKPLSEKKDIYELIWNKCSEHNPAFTFWPTPQYRKTFKRILMPIFMKEYTLQHRIYCWNYIDKQFANHPRKYTLLGKDDKELYESYRMFVDLTGLPIQEMLSIIQTSMHEVLNTDKFAGSKIFIHESNLHLLIREKFMEMGIRTVNIYDGFYFADKRVTKKLFNSIYETSLAELKHYL